MMNEILVTDPRATVVFNKTIEEIRSFLREQKDLPDLMAEIKHLSNFTFDDLEALTERNFDIPDLEVYRTYTMVGSYVNIIIRKKRNKYHIYVSVSMMI